MDNQHVYRDLGLRIRAYRKSRGMTLSELARQLNKSVPTVSKYESGDVAISVDALLDICRILNVEAGTLLPSTSTHPEIVDVSRYEKYYEEVIYIYWYNGERGIIRSALIDNRNASRMESTMFYDIDSLDDLDAATFIYSGTMNYSETGTAFHYTNTLPPFDKMALRIPSFTRKQPHRVGLMTTLSYYYQNVATKVLASSVPIHDREALLPELKISSEEIKEIRRTNFFIV